MSVPRWNKVMVTGGSSGIGAAIARRVAPECAELTVVGRDEQRTRAVAADLAQWCDARPLVADLSEALGLEEVDRRIRSESPPLDLLVNCAGYAATGAFLSRPVTEHLELMAVNVEALLVLSYTAAQEMSAVGRGSILNISSLAAFRAAPGNTVYAASKAFVNSFSQGLAAEVAPAGVQVTCVCPGFTRTRFADRAKADFSGVNDELWQEADEVAAGALAALADGLPLSVSSEFVHATASKYLQTLHDDLVIRNPLQRKEVQR
jgi:short-subunit dehydrogenase